MTDKEDDLRNAYWTLETDQASWSLSALEATPDDYRRLLAEMEMKANED